MPTSTETTIDRAPRIVLVLAFLVLMLEGYDIIMYGTVVPSLLTYSSWSLTPEDAGHIGSLAVLGMLFGALGAAVLNDRVGRRRVLIGSVFLFSIAMLAAAAAGSPGQLGAFRFLVGVGAGSLLPTAVAMVIEYSPASRRGLNTAIVFAGVGLGGILASLLGTWIAPNYGFRLMFAIGALPALIIVPETNFGGCLHRQGNRASFFATHTNVPSRSNGFLHATCRLVSGPCCDFD